MTTFDKKVELDEVVELAERYRTWGKWGPDDELGALNYVTPGRITASAGLVRKGKVFSLAIPLDAEGPMNGAYGRNNPTHVLTRDGGDIARDAVDGLDACDGAVFLSSLHCSTQWDALAHIFYGGRMYNDRGPEDVVSSGAVKNSIARAKQSMVGRGVLLDIPRLLGKKWLEPGEAIEAEDLEACCEAQGVEVEEGDFVLIRTGRIAAIEERESWGDEFAGGSAPGLGVSTAPFLCERKVAAMATDTFSTEAIPYQSEPALIAPLHVILLVNAGIHLGEIFDMEALAADCAEDGVYEFQFVAPPLTITGAVGSPVNPQAIK